MTKTVLFGVACALLVASSGAAILWPRGTEPEAPAATQTEPADAPFASILQPLRFDDAAGDAYENGEPAPHLDILGVGFAQETREDLRFTLEIAKLTEGMPELETDDAIHRMISYSICWGDGTGCGMTASLDVMVHEGKAHLVPLLTTFDSDCNEWGWCTWSVGAEVEYGSPATITFVVPKALAAFGSERLSIGSLAGDVVVVTMATAFPMWHPGVTVHTPAYHFHTHGGDVGMGLSADSTDLFDAGLEPVASTEYPEHPLDAPLSTGHGIATHGYGSPFDYPELDIVGWDLYEENGDFVLLLAVREFEAVPDYEFDYEVAVGFEGGQVWEIGYRQEGGRAYGYSGRCIMEECQDGIVMEVPVEITTGSPGLIAIRTPMASIFPGGEPDEDLRTDFVWAAAMYIGGSIYWGEYGEDYFGDYHSAFTIDSVFGGAPYVFGSGHRASPDAFSEHVHPG